MKEDAQTVLNKAKSLETDLNKFRYNWDETARYFKPQLDTDRHAPQSPDSTGFPGLFDTTGIEALDTYAHGLIAEAFSITQKWIVFVPQDELDVDDEGKKWYNKCSEITLTHLGRNGFYQKLKPAVTDMGVAGTGSLYVERGTKKLLNFKYDRLGTFAIEEDHEGDIRTEFRWRNWCATDIVEKFGEEVAGPKVMEAYRKEEMGKDKTMFTVIHGVFPRENAGGMEAENKQYASIYVCEEDKNILEVSGYDYFPFAPMRAEIWNDYNYGIGPAQKALPAMRELNKVTRDTHEAVSMSVKPPWLIPANMVDEVSNKPNGVTVFDPSTPHKPEQMNIRMDIGAGMTLAESIREQIRKFFHAALFEAIAEKDKQMTAREIAAIESSALKRFLPSFNQITTEMAPIFQNVFLILFEAKAFPEPPESVKFFPQGAGKPGVVPLPKVEFTSRIALALRMIENSAIDRLLERLLPMLEVAPELADNFDLDEMVREAARNDGISEDLLKKVKDVMEVRGQRASQMAQEQQMAAMSQAAVTAKDASQADPETLGQLQDLAQASGM